MEPPVRNAQDRTSFKIRALAVRRHQLTDMRTAEKNRTEHIRDAFAEQSIPTVIGTIETQIRLIQERIRDLIASSPELRQKNELIQSVPCIGENTPTAIGTLRPGQIAALTGTAPVNRGSGQFRGKRRTGGGRSETGSLMHMPALAAIRHRPVIRRFFQRLLSAGKTRMVPVTHRYCQQNGCKK